MGKQKRQRVVLGTPTPSPAGGRGAGMRVVLKSSKTNGVLQTSTHLPPAGDGTVVAASRLERNACRQRKTFVRGFSLLEVMVALALLAISFTSLILVQARAVRLANEARNITIATQLARYQLMECKNEVQKKIATVGDFNVDGDFADIGHAGFTWECHAPKFNMKPPSASEIDKNIKNATPDKAKKDVGATAAVSSPFISMITDALGESVRELVVIVRWTDNGIEDEVRVVTHVNDLTAMSNLSRMLEQGVKTFQDSMPGKKDDKPEEKKAPSPEAPRAPGGAP